MLRFFGAINGFEKHNYRAFLTKLHFNALKSHKFKVIKLTRGVFCSMIPNKFKTGQDFER